MKKLKADKNFKPPPFDEGDEFYPNGIFEFNITKLLAFISKNPDQFPVEEVKVESVRKFVSSKMNEPTIQTANLANPIMLAEISPGHFNVIDGNHRLEKAHRDGLDRIPTYRVTADHHLAFITSGESYKKYVAYWNSKVDEL